MAMEELNAYLATNTYLGSTTCPTLVDYKKCREVSADVADATKFPHIARWHSHISYLLKAYPTYDRTGAAVPAGQLPKMGGASQAPGSPKGSPKGDPPGSPKGSPKGSPEKEPAPKKEAAAKKEAAPKAEGKKKGQDKKEAPPAAPEDPEKARKDKLKKVLKEGGKRGVEIEGAADMGGLQFFCTSVDVPDGDLEMLVASMNAMNEKSDPTEEERKGGSGHVGKMIFSAGTEQLAVVAYVPKEKQAELSCEEWLQKVVESQGGTVVASSKDICQGTVKADGNKNIFPLKIREPMLLEANNFLRKKGLFPEDKDSDDDYVFGDDDFPS